jgi:outer membrane lipoprotein LolB
VRSESARAAAAARWRLAHTVVAALMLAACAGAPQLAPTPTPVAGDAPFAIDGRLSARRGSDAVTANFTWRHASPRDDLVVTTPLGQAVAEITGDTLAQRVEMRTPDGRHEDAADWATLTGRAIGVPLPIAGLAAWIQGVAHAGAPHSVELDAAGRPLVLRQDGWEIVYGYADDAGRAPTRLRLAYPDLEVRIVVDRWR